MFWFLPTYPSQEWGAVEAGVQSPRILLEDPAGKGVASVVVKDWVGGAARRSSTAVGKVAAERAARQPSHELVRFIDRATSAAF